MNIHIHNVLPVVVLSIENDPPPPTHTHILLRFLRRRYPLIVVQLMWYRVLHLTRFLTSGSV